MSDRQSTGVGPRVPPVAPGTRPELAAIERVIRAERGGIPLLYEVLLNSAPLAEGWEKLLTAIRNRSSVPADLREMIILRVAALNQAPFELEAHMPIARQVGVAEAKIQAIRDGEIGGMFSPVERAALELTDVMTRQVQ